MSRSFIHLRRMLFGTSCVIVFGFGATQALAAPKLSSWEGCDSNMVVWCENQCAGPGTGRCTWFGFYYCECIYN